ncbi:hypothetical protein A6R68_14665 [Neotoma lepida]|uniref:Cytochrome b-c1 complex subunit 10 n=1 Tax=Neotoma lepida TaxID=56216 RepID=A0A1A6HA83_NEOLE|nr:hypothetical protein A6R68_14665 [Neotoma lepida]
MLSRFLGPRYRELAKNWVPTASMWGAVGAVGLVWATDWRLILDWVPYINGKCHFPLPQKQLSLVEDAEEDGH